MKVKVCWQKYVSGYYFCVYPLKKDGSLGTYLEQFGLDIPDEALPKVVKQIEKSYAKRRVK